MNAAEAPDHATQLLAIYDEAVADVHGYLLRRCRTRLVAEDLTSEAFLAAVAAIKAGKVETVSVAWMIGIARHKLLDHWRRQEREQRRLQAVAGELSVREDDDWSAVIERRQAEDLLAGLAPQYRAALTLRYLDGLPVAEVAGLLDRTHGATEALLTRAKRAFRAAHARQGGDHD